MRLTYCGIGFQQLAFALNIYLAKMFRTFTQIIAYYRSSDEAQGHTSQAIGNDNTVFQHGSGHWNFNQGNFNRTSQQGLQQQNRVEGNKNGTAQFGAKNVSRTDGHKNRTGQNGANNESLTGMNRHTSTQFGVGHKHDSGNCSGNTCNEGDLGECALHLQGQPHLLQYINYWQWAWNMAWVWVSAAPTQ